MNPRINRKIVLARRPNGVPVAEDFRFEESQVRDPGPGEILVRNRILSIDPAIRGWMDDKKSYIPPIQIGEAVRSGTLSEVVASDVAHLPVGTLIQALAAWEDYSTISVKYGVHGIIDPGLDLPLTTRLSVLGGNGLTAYFGLLDVGQPREGDTVVVSAAAGGVGSVVCQLAKLKGCRVVGIAGGPDKCQWLIDELGCDAAIDYKNDDVRAALKTAAPKGVDVFFDNVGGEILNAVLWRLSIGARVVICGAISQIHEKTLPPGPSGYVQLMAKRARMQGFMTLDYAGRYDDARADLAGWIREGKLRYRDEVAQGLESAPRHFLRLFDGTHRGKLMVELGEPPSQND